MCLKGEEPAVLLYRDTHTHTHATGTQEPQVCCVWAEHLRICSLTKQTSIQVAPLCFRLNGYAEISELQLIW